MSSVELKNLYLKILGVDPNNLEANEGMARILLDEGHPEAALSYIEKSISRGTSDRRLQIHAAYYFAKGYDFRRAGDILVNKNLSPENNEEKLLLFETLSRLAGGALKEDKLEESFKYSLRAMSIPGMSSGDLENIMVDSATKIADRECKRGNIKNALDTVSSALNYLPANAGLLKWKSYLDNRLKAIQVKKIKFISTVAAPVLLMLAVGITILVVFSGNSEKADEEEIKGSDDDNEIGGPVLSDQDETNTGCSDDSLYCEKLPGIDLIGKELHRAAYRARTSERNNEKAICFLKKFIREGPDSKMMGLAYFELHANWKAKGCREKAYKNIVKSLQVRSRGDAGFVITCRACKNLDMGPCPGCTD